MTNIVLNPGALGATLGTDTVAGVDYQIVKLGYSVSGAAPTQVSTANPLPVVQTGALPAGANVIGAVTQSGAPWSENITQLGGNAINLGTGNTGTGTQRVVIATDQPTLTNAQPVLQSGTWNINNISGTITLPTGAATAAKQPALGTAGAASADVITVQGVAGMTKLLVTPDSVALPANQSVNLSQVAGTTTDTNSGNKSAGTIRVVIATDQPSLSNALPVTQSGTWTVQPGNTANTTPWLVTDTPATSGGLSFVAIPVSAATNNKTQVKGAAGQLYTISAQNLNASPRYLKVFNNTSAGVTMGTTPCDFQFLIPGNTAGAGLLINIDKGIAMGTGITIAVTAGISATDNTSILVSEVTVLIGYK